MLDRALLFIKDALDTHLRQRLGAMDSLVVLNHLHGGNSPSSQKNQNRLVMTLVAIEHETFRPFYAGQSGEGTEVQRNPPQYFNLRILFAANFEDYAEALKVVSETILFFQANNSFDAKIHTDIPVELSPLQIVVEDATETKAHDMWSALGAHYVPSVIYKLRRLTMDAAQIRGFQTTMKAAAVRVGL